MVQKEIFYIKCIFLLQTLPDNLARSANLEIYFYFNSLCNSKFSQFQFDLENCIHCQNYLYLWFAESGSNFRWNFNLLGFHFIVTVENLEISRILLMVLSESVWERDVARMKFDKFKWVTWCVQDLDVGFVFYLQQNMPQHKECNNCHAVQTTIWRRDRFGNIVCNACGLYYKLHNYDRPGRMRRDEIHKRNRKKHMNESKWYLSDENTMEFVEWNKQRWMEGRVWTSQKSHPFSGWLFHCQK